MKLKYALLIIDMNVGAFNPELRGGILHRAKDFLVPCINELASAFRARNLPVIWVTQRYKDDLSNAPRLQRERGDMTYAESGEGWKILPELYVLPSDRLVIKRCFSAFHDTNLLELLQGMGITSLVIPGVNTYACVREATLGAYDFDFWPLVWPENGTASSLPQFDAETRNYMIGDNPALPGLVKLLPNDKIITLLDS